MGWPSYPTYLERMLLASRAFSPRFGSVIGPVTYSNPLNTNTIVNLAPGTLELELDLEIPAGTTLTLQGSTALAAAGTISAVTATVPATNTRGNITNTVGDPAFIESNRLRLTSGGNNTAIAWITGLPAGNIARVNRWGLGGANGINVIVVEPAIGTTYAVDNLQTTITGLTIRIRGDGKLLIRDCNISTDRAIRLENGQVSTAGIHFYACRFTGIFNIFYDRQAAYVSCQFDNVTSYSNTLATIRNSVFRSNVDFVTGSLGNFGRSCCVRGKMTVRQGLVQFASTPGDVQFVDQPADHAIEIQLGGWIDADPGAVAWGSNNGAMPAAIHVRSGAIYTYADASSKPIIPGGVSDVNLGGTLFAYAAIPAINPVNNAAMVLRA